jgi:hypothetical protein
MNQANYQRFVNEREVVLESANQDAAATIVLWERHTGMIDAGHHAGALSDWERGKIFERYNTEYSIQDIDEAQRTLDATWTSFWNALRKAEMQQLQGQPAG